MASAQPINWPALAPAIASRLLGEPNKRLSSARELRYGTHGSLSVDLEKGSFYDHEANAGGGMLRARLMWRHGIDCMIAIVILSIPVAVALGLMMRRGAPTDRKGSALAIGLAGAGWGAFVFIFQCPHDDPFYVAVWYGAGAAAVALIWWLILPRVTRW